MESIFRVGVMWVVTGFAEMGGGFGLMARGRCRVLSSEVLMTSSLVVVLFGDLSLLRRSSEGGVLLRACWVTSGGTSTRLRFV